VVLVGLIVLYFVFQIFLLLGAIATAVLTSLFSSV
jgi:hypothetical protein